MCCDGLAILAGIGDHVMVGLDAGRAKGRLHLLSIVLMRRHRKRCSASDDGGCNLRTRLGGKFLGYQAEVVMLFFDCQGVGRFAAWRAIGKA